MELHQLGIAELADGYRQREFSPVEVVEALLARIESIGNEVDAFATVTAETAFAQAIEAEGALGQGDDRPLLGIPVAVKDLIDTAGIVTEAGSALFAGRTPFEDAPVWSALRHAGCVLIGKARTHEFAFGSSTPPTTNPWNTSHIPGGSSGGSAAALAAGLTPAAIGTDTAVVDQDPLRSLRHRRAQAHRNSCTDRRRGPFVLESRQRRAHGAQPS